VLNKLRSRQTKQAAEKIKMRKNKCRRNKEKTLWKTGHKTTLRGTSERPYQSMQLFKLPHCKQQGRLMHDFRPIFRVNGQFHDRLAVHICWDVSVNRPRSYGRLNCGCIFLPPQTFWGPSLHKCVGFEHVLEIREAQCGINNGLSLCLSLLGLGHRRGVKKIIRC